GGPRVCFINKMDRLGADFEIVVEELRTRLHANPALIQIPMGAGDDYQGQINLIHRKAYFYDEADVATTVREEEIPDQYAAQAAVARQELIDLASDYDDGLMEQALVDGYDAVEPGGLIRGIRKGTLARQLHPVLCGSALKHMGIQALLDAVVDFLPGPPEAPPVHGHLDLASDEVVIRECDPHGPLSALVFKISSDSHGDLNFARIYSGTLEAGSRVLNSTQGKKENISRIWRMHAKQREALDEAFAGDIVAVVGMKNALTGDTLCDTKDPVVLERLEFPDPVISMSIEPRTNADKQPLAEALHTLQREDPSFKYTHDQETGQTVISGMGELHLEIVKNKLVRDLGLEVRVGKPRVAYKETVLGSAEAEASFVRQTGGRGQYAVVTMRVEAWEPENRDEPIAFEDATKGGVISKEFIPAVRQGVMDSSTSGPLAGYPMLNVKATLLDGKEHPVDSSDVAFSQAGSMAFQQAAEQAKAVFLEPIMRVSVSTPEEYLGAVTGDLTARRAIIRNQETRGKYRVLSAEAPLAEMFGYETQLRSLTQGRGNSTMEPHSYAPAPQQVAERILRYV
ncbi:MAG: elongation factor G, partial [Phycisphaerae bacterium]|nr:elongation factor G [Phycisphaerae bacterium]